VENLEPEKQIDKIIKDTILERYLEEKKQSEIKCQTAMLTLEIKSTFPEFLDFIKENFTNEHATQKKLVLEVFASLLDGYEIYETTYGVNATKDHFYIFVDTSTYSKKITFSYSNVPKPDFINNEILYDREGYQTTFWKAYKTYIQTPNFNNLLIASKENTVLRKGKINKFLGILQSFKKLRDEDRIGSFLTTEKKILDSREKEKELIKEYNLDQLNAEVGFEGYKDLVIQMANLGWIVSIRGINAYDTIYFKEIFRKKDEK